MNYNNEIRICSIVQLKISSITSSATQRTTAIVVARNKRVRFPRHDRESWERSWLQSWLSCAPSRAKRARLHTHWKGARRLRAGFARDARGLRARRRGRSRARSRAGFVRASRGLRARFARDARGLRARRRGRSRARSRARIRGSFRVNVNRLLTLHSHFSLSCALPRPLLPMSH